MILGFAARRRPLPAGARPLAVAVACAALAATACGSTAEVDGPKSATESLVRDTTIRHEPCDDKSSEAVRVDVKGNGKPAIIHVMSGGREVCRVLDLNMDGAPDAFIYYDAQGRERRREQDFDRDGRADEITVFENGQVKLKMRETNFDNKIDTWDYYENGRLVRRERDSDGDGVVDQWWNFNNPANPKCATVAVDKNADGKPDPESVVDLCADPNSPLSKPAAPAPPAAPPGSAPPPAPAMTAPPPASGPASPPPATPPAKK